nr:MAG TPA: hypothetical protein [Bacteriophage sp.]
MAFHMMKDYFMYLQDLGILMTAYLNSLLLIIAE